MASSRESVSSRRRDSMSVAELTVVPWVSVEGFSVQRWSQCETFLRIDRKKSAFGHKPKNWTNQNFGLKMKMQGDHESHSSISSRDLDYL